MHWRGYLVEAGAEVLPVMAELLAEMAVSSEVVEGVG